MENIEIVGCLFDWDVDDLDAQSIADLEVSKFADLVVTKKQEEGWSAAFNIPCGGSDEDIVCAVLSKLEEARTTLNEEKFKSLWDCFKFTNDIGVWGGDLWAPRLFPNGGVLYRNHHRVIALETENVAGKIYKNNVDVRADLQKVQDNFDTLFPNQDENDKYFNFNILHWDTEGLHYLDTLPETLSDYGNTLVYVGAGVFNSDEYQNTDLGFLSGYDCKETHSNSRAGGVFLRVFKDITFIYSNFRASDELDTIVENFYDVYIDEFGSDYGHPDITTDYRKITSVVKELIENNPPDIFWLEFFEDDKHPELRKLVEESLYSKWASEKTQQITSLDAIFGSAWDRPATYYGEQIPFLDYQKESDTTIYSIGFTLDKAVSIENLEDEIKSQVYTIADEAWHGRETFKVYLRNENEDVTSATSYELGSEEWTAAFAAFKERILNDFNEVEEYELGDEDHEREHFENCGYDYCVDIVITDDEGTLQIGELHSVGLKASQAHDGSLSVTMPSIGFYQGYCEGELDTGNVKMYITDEEIQDAEDDWGDDDWD